VQGFFAMGSDFFHLPGLARHSLGSGRKDDV